MVRVQSEKMHASNESCNLEGGQDCGLDFGRKLVPLWGVCAVWGMVLIGSIVATASIGNGGSGFVRVASVVEIFTGSGWMALVYLLGAWGYGRLVWLGKGSACDDHTDRSMVWVARLGVGISVMLSVTHLMGGIGILSSVSAWIVSGVGIGLGMIGVLREQATAQRMGGLDRSAVIIGGIGVAVIGLMIVMASNPAGVLWDSEFGGFDSLSYHLELPREWMESGRVWPVEWNVYSFLPSYMEAAYVHMGYLAGDGQSGLGLASDEGQGIYAAQYLSVMLSVLSAVVSGVVGQRVCRVLGFEERVAQGAGWVAGVLVLLTPWMVVVGTLSYNESAVVLLTMSGLGIALVDEWSVVRRTVGAAVVMGVACSCKPTALFLAAPMVGVVLLANAEKKDWWRVIVVGSVVGAAVLLPWLVRNEMATGNPVFPQLSGVFGEGHWSARQHEVYSAAHSFDGGVFDRLKLLVLPDVEGATHVSKFRGLTNIQWGLTAGFGILGLLVLLGQRRTHRAGFVCAVGIGVVLLAWMGLTHVQSRFLVPMIGVFAVLGGIGIAGTAMRRVFVPLGLLGSVVWLGVWVVGQAGGHPNRMLVAGVGAYTGELKAVGFDEVLWWNGVNSVANDGRAVYLVGDATPLYIRSGVVYNTVYDDWLLGELMREVPGEPAAWNHALAEHGIGWVVISLGEIERYAESGWSDPEVTVDRVIEWSRSLGDPVMVWGESGRAMFRVGGTTISGMDLERGDND